MHYFTENRGVRMHYFTEITLFRGSFVIPNGCIRRIHYLCKMNSIEVLLSERVLVLDGAMGTMIQKCSLSEADFRGERFAAHKTNLAGCNDLLSITRPDVIADIHAAYLKAGADIISTCSFNANSISLADYGLSAMVGEINLAAARLARSVADRYSEPGHPRLVAGSMGPSGVSLSMGQESVDFDTLADTYRVQAKALIEGGCDLLLLETVFDPINAKAAGAGILEAFASLGRKVPLIISATLTEAGRLLSGQSLEAFIIAMEHLNPLAVGLNCGFGAEKLLPWLDILDKTPYYVSMHPNAGLPDALGRYTETPEDMAAQLAAPLAEGKLNIVGGCCGTTPLHIAAIAYEARKAVPHVPAPAPDTLQLSGMLPLASDGFVKVGERCNVAGSRKFLRLINEGNYSEAVETAAAQVAAGASVIDINMDDGLLDASREMNGFIDRMALDAEASKVPLMIDSSSHEVIMSALRHIQGRPIVNSISLKEGEEVFLNHARDIMRLGAAVVVMAFDEHGQATTRDRKTEICARAYRLLTEKLGFPPHDIIFDPNVLTIATGMEEHDRYGLDFLEATEWIHNNLPQAGVSGGVSNLSFAFRGNDPLRRDIHTTFVSLARERGLTMAILNPTTPLVTDAIDPERLSLIEDALLRPSSHASVALTEYAMAHLPAKKNAPAKTSGSEQRPDTLADLIYKGADTGLEKLIAEALEADGSAMTVVSERLMPGMNRVGEEFAAGRLFLPQVVRSAAIMKQAFALLAPAMEAEKESDAGGASRRIVLATVKGDVHDIGKNIVAAVMRCSGFEVIDLGVMVPPEKIIDTAVETEADCIGLSGLITPSLNEMTRVATMLDERGLRLPLFIGGATTSPLHTALKIAPVYRGLVAHSGDAASLPALVTSLLDPATGQEAAAALADSQRVLREGFRGATPGATRPAPSGVSPSPAPGQPGQHDFSIDPAELTETINYRALLSAWHFNPALVNASPADSPEAAEAHRLIADTRNLIDELSKKGVRLQSRVVILDARSSGDDIIAADGAFTIPTLRSRDTADGQKGVALSDFVAESNDHIALFTATSGRDITTMLQGLRDSDDYNALLLQSVADRLAEAATQWTHHRVAENEWGYRGAQDSWGIRPAVGYPSLPDQSLAMLFDKVLHTSELGITITENGALHPSSTTMGVILASPKASYFDVKGITETTFADYARRRGYDPEKLRPFISTPILS